MILADRTEINKTLDMKNYLPPFFSVLLPELGRPECVIRCVKHLIRFADMPFEIIVHDDGSGIRKQLQLLSELSPFASIIIMNTGKNSGLATACNRCRKMARSKYLLKMDVDTFITSGIMKNVKAALDLQYCGIVNIVPSLPQPTGTKGIYTSTNRSKVELSRSTALTSLIFGIRSDVWDDAGGWDENVQTTASDVGFLGSVYGTGKFVMTVEGTYLNDSFFTDDGLVSNGLPNPNYVSSARFADGDNNPPILMNVPKGSQEAMRHKRREDCWHGTNDTRLAEIAGAPAVGSWYNHGYYDTEITNIFPKDKYIDWEHAKKHGHDKWKDMAILDFNLGKE